MCLSCRFVNTYAHRFIELYGYAPAFVAIGRQKACRFVWSLPAYMQKTLLGYSDLNFIEAIDQAQQFELLDGRLDSDGIEEVSKKARIEPRTLRCSGS